MSQPSLSISDYLLPETFSVKEAFSTDPASALETVFRSFHSHPELSLAEYRTTASLRRLLEDARIRILDLPLETGLVAEIGEGDGPITLLRCDIDALAIEENTDLPWQSRNPGVMHACGHDFHTTAVLGAALLLKAKESQLPGRVRLIFQPAEEMNRGARMVIAAGALKGASSVYGLHTSPALPAGTLGIRAGAVTAAVDRFEVTFSGRGGHGAHPNLSLDPVPAAASFIMNAQTLISRRVNPFHNAVVSITHVEGGKTWNVIPDDVYLEGTVRSHDAADRSMLEEGLRSLARLTAEAHDLKADFGWEAGPPATRNDPESARLARDVAENQGLIIREPEESMIGEDFAFYQERIPGCFIMVGTGIGPSLHNPAFKADTAALWPASRYLAELAEAALKA